jgi:hypothetical protein
MRVRCNAMRTLLSRVNAAGPYLCLVVCPISAVLALIADWSIILTVPVAFCIVAGFLLFEWLDLRTASPEHLAPPLPVERYKPFG